ncbi:MAG: Fur family transcriptional regulator [Verrucomicrobiota bacterium]
MNQSKDPSTNNALLQKEIKDFLQKKGFRITKQRLAILETLFQSKDCFHAEELWDKVIQEDASVSRPTVYRTLKLLLEGGFLRPLDLGRDQQYYDLNTPDQAKQNHIICKDCNKIIEFNDPCLDIRESALIKELGFNPKNMTFKVEATCQELNSTGQCDRKDTESDQE